MPFASSLLRDLEFLTPNFSMSVNHMQEQITIASESRVASKVREMSHLMVP
jgi:hypothetical protein